MMSHRDFRAELKQEETLRATQGMPVPARHAVRLRLQGTLQPRARRTVPRWIWAGAFTMAMVVVLLVLGRAPPTPEALGRFQIVSASRELTTRQHAEDLEIEKGQATLVDAESGVTVQNLGPLVFRQESGGLRIVRGGAELSVTTRLEGSAPAVVRVSDGEIQVLGTRFTVQQGEGRGTVTLHEGAIRFVPARGGSEVRLQPGQSLDWPLPEEPAVPGPPPPISTLPAPPSNGPRSSKARPPGEPKTPQLSAEEFLREVDVLRSRKEFEGAARLLGEGLRTQPPAMRELLSFELGSLLTYQLRDPRRACTHWAWHGRQFIRGRYDAEVSRAQAVLDCPRDGQEREP
ncbi:FecR domain-containing protein [Archangium lansingense]|uniref:FecR domain-containing protein n=1 Tax=Archangium lansingense TaxID=2995310 RepID=A0ABT3ZYN0_9BACT|nr:FecR domain-containing protein [Archangium lansinium]MCY1074426.1 FecR domain-containing protein [Archangium lansinium]